MHIARRTLTFVRGFLLSYGPTSVKKLIWDKEFSSTKWDFIDNTVGDCVYPNLEKYARNGTILDLGCGPGNTASELSPTAYESYVGVDISEAALEKARKRTAENGRGGKNIFFQCDFINFQPNQKFDVILFRESMYHVPMGKIKETLDRYSSYLKENGVFIVRMATGDSNSQGKDKPRPAAMVRIIEKEFEVVEKHIYKGTARPTVLIFRPRHRD